MGKTKVVLDSNILISALGWSGKLRTIFEKCLDGELELVTSSAQLDELIRVMDYPKFKFSEEQKLSFISIITTIATFVEVRGALNIIEDDCNDNAILETAVNGSADYIISGDLHLLTLAEFLKVKIVTANDFLGS